MRHLHIAEGEADPEICRMVRLDQVLRVIKSTQAKKQDKGMTRLPISIEILGKMKAAWQEMASPDAEMLWAAAAQCWFGFLRSEVLTMPSESAYDEGAHLNFHDISVDSFTNPQVLQVAIKRSKTDPFHVGVTIYIGRTNCELCPVVAVLAYVHVVKTGPLFRFADGRPLTQPWFVMEVKQALTRAGVDSTCYSGHSFRCGAATTAACRGIGDATIKMLGWLKSNAYQVYIKTAREQLAKSSVGWEWPSCF